MNGRDSAFFREGAVTERSRFGIEMMPWESRIAQLDFLCFGALHYQTMPLDHAIQPGTSDPQLPGSLSLVAPKLVQYGLDVPRFGLSQGVSCRVRRPRPPDRESVRRSIESTAEDDIIIPDYSAPGKNHRPSKDVFQLPQVPRPWVS